MKYLSIVFLSLLFFACGTQKKTTTTLPDAPPVKAEDVKELPQRSSARYTIHYDAPGRTAQIGDIVLIHVANYNADDSLLYNTFAGLAPVPMEITAPEFKGDLMEAMVMVSKGDSLSVLIPVDSLENYESSPGIVEPGEDIRLVIKVVELMTKDEYKEYEAKKQKEQVSKDAKLIEGYLNQKGIKATKTSSGLYYVIDKKGTGPNPTPGQTVDVHYTGTLLNGQKFDSSRDRGEPFSFMIGKGQVIGGWDEGIALLNKGAKARLFIPSHLGYGAHGAGADIPPNSVLIFDVELIDIK